MTDTQSADTPAPAGPLFKIKIAKAEQVVEVAWVDLSDDVRTYIVEQGLSKVLNSATAKETKATTPDDTTRKANALALANKKLDSLKRGEFKRTKAAGKVPGAVMTEARRLAKNIVKAAIKAAGEKISDYEAKTITEEANAYIDQHPELVAQAEASIAAAQDLAAKTGVNVKSIPVSEKKKAARIEANAKKRAETAAKDAGKPGPQASKLKKGATVVPPKARPQPQQQAH